MTPSQWRHGCAHALPRCAGNTAGVGSYVKRATTKAQASRPESRTRAIWPFQQKIVSFLLGRAPHLCRLKSGRNVPGFEA